MIVPRFSYIELLNRRNQSRIPSSLLSYHIPRIYNKSINENDSKLSVEDCHHLIDVLRLKSNDKFRIFNEKEGEYLCALLEAQNSAIKRRRKSTFSYKIISKLREINEDNNIRLNLYFAPIKKPRLKLMFEKCTELGISNFIPVKTQHTQYDISESDQESFEKVLVAASEQSERLSVPTLQKTINLNDFFLSSISKQKNLTALTDPIFVCKERGEIDSLPLIERLNPLLTRLVPCPSSLSILIGPEGGFSADEIQKLSLEKNIQFVTLGNHVLRAETAAIAACSFLNMFSCQKNLNK